MKAATVGKCDSFLSFRFHLSDSGQKPCKLPSVWGEGHGQEPDVLMKTSVTQAWPAPLTQEQLSLKA